MMDEIRLPQKNVFVVLGMPRSGTSAITRGLKALGIELGKEFGVGKNKWNPTGIWEDKDIVYKINRGVSLALNDTWMSIHLIDKECRNNVALNDLKLSAIAILKKRFASTEDWAFKDPRTARILPFWQDVFAALNLQDNYIITLRNPLSSAYSWQKMHGADIEVGLLLWLIHLIPAIDGTQGKKRVMVSYDLMLKDPCKQLERIKTNLTISLPTNLAELDVYANEFLDKKLHHYEYTEEDLKLHPATKVVSICSKIYALFIKVANDEILLNGDEFSQEWQKLKNEFYEVYPVYCYLNLLLKKNKQYEREMRTIRRSLPWKLAYPLRVIDDALRAIRKKSRERRSLIKTYE